MIPPLSFLSDTPGDWAMFATMLRFHTGLAFRATLRTGVTIHAVMAMDQDDAKVHRGLLKVLLWEEATSSFEHPGTFDFTDAREVVVL